MAMKRKAIFFTLIAISLSAVIFLAFVIGAEYRLRNKMFVIETRIDTLNSFIQDLQKDLERGLSISSFRALLAVEQYILLNGTYSQDIQKDFRDALINGTIKGNKIDVMENSSFTDWMEKISKEASKIDIVVDFKVQDPYIYHDQPWSVKVNLELQINVTDKRKTAAWYKIKNMTVDVGIEGFEDPLYSLNSLGRVSNTIRKTPYSSFFNDNNLRDHANKSYYINSSLGPSFLMRLEGNLGNHTQGIESLVNLQKFIDQGLTIYTKSGVDYLYFGNQSISSCQVNETAIVMPWFRLDADHLPVYDATCA